MSDEHPTPCEVEAWRCLLEAHARVVERVEIALDEAGLPSITWYDVLYTLYRAPERRLRMFELADAVVMSRSGLTRLVDRLEAQGLLARLTCPSDRRGSFVHLEERGVDLLRRMWPVYAAALAEHFSPHVADPRGVADLLGPLAAAHRAPDPAAAPPV